LNARNQDSAAPLHIAAQQNSGSLVKTVIHQRGDVTLRLDDKRTALHLAAEHGAAVAAAVLLQEDPEKYSRGYRGAAVAGEDEGPPPPPPGLALLELQSDKGETPLLRAASRGHAALVQLLLQTKADLESKNWWGQSALRLACHGGHLGTAQILLNSQAKVSTQAQDGSTPLHAACERGHAKVAELLLTVAEKAPPPPQEPGMGPPPTLSDMRAVRGLTALHMAAERGFLEVASILLARKADIDARSDEERTALSYATARGHTQVVKKLIDSKCALQVLDNIKRSPLHLAAAGGRFEAAELLIERRVLLDLQDLSGRSALSLAMDAKQDAIVRLLIENGAKMPTEENSELSRYQQEVESELMHKALSEATSGEAVRKMKELEEEFEILRQKMVKLAVLTASVEPAPDVSQCEKKIDEALQLIQLYEFGCKSYREELERMEGEMKTLRIEVGKKQSIIQNKEISLQDAKKKLRLVSDELFGLKREVAEARDRAKKRAEQAAAEDRARKVKEIMDEVAQMQSKIAQERADAEMWREKTENVRDQVEWWEAQASELGKLHVQSHEILTKRPVSPERS